MSVVLPEVNFTSTNPQDIVDDVVAVYEEHEKRRLYPGDPVYIIILSLSSALAKAHTVINHAAKQNLLYYSSDDVLDHKGYSWNTPRLGNDHAKTTIKFVLSTSLEKGKIIPKGERLTEDGNIIFETTEDAVVAPGEREVFAPARCREPGTIGNGFEPGDIDTLVVPIPYVTRVENVTTSAGGTDKESDDEYRKRIQMAPEKMSTAGPEGAYEYHAKKSSSDIGDIFVDTPEPGKIHISMIMKKGRLPTEEEVNSMLEQVTDRKVRPLTDYVTGGPPERVEYDLDITYYIDSESVDKGLIQNNIEKAIQEYEVWQSGKIGRDINPSHLTTMCVKAGAKRIEINSPPFTVIKRGEIAVLRSRNVSFGGEEDD